VANVAASGGTVEWHATSQQRALCGKLRKPPATRAEDARFEDSPSGWRSDL